MKTKFPVQKFWSNNLNDIAGEITLTPEAVKMIAANPEMLSFGISFIGEPQEDGTYKNCELIGVSIIHKDKFDGKSITNSKTSN